MVTITGIEDADGSMKSAKKSAKTVPVRLLSDVWREDDVRTPSGSVVELPVADAKALIADGKAERADPMPGEDD